MKNCLFTIITALILTSCYIAGPVYKNIRVEKFQPSIEEITTLTEVRYEGVFSAYWGEKVMYDRFGKWDEVAYMRYSPILFWHKVKLFPNDTTEFIVAARGVESTKTTYVSFLVFDQQNKDLLAEGSEYKTRLIEYFSEMIKANDPKKKDFYEIYWKAVDPNREERIKQYKKNN